MDAPETLAPADDFVIRDGLLMEGTKFWMIWTKMGRKPHSLHFSATKAIHEAGRLAKKHPDRKFIILESVIKISDADHNQPRGALTTD